MARFLARRIASAFVLLLIVLSVAFFFTRLLPGSPAARSSMTSRLTPEQIEILRSSYGLDRPAVEQYFTWLGNIFFRWDWGPSFSYRQPAAQVLRQALPNTLLLGLATLIIQYALGLVLGVLTAHTAGGRVDNVLRGLSLSVFSIPSFWLATLAIFLFHERWHLLPAGGMASPGSTQVPLGERWLDLFHHLILPASVLGLLGGVMIAQYLRNNLVEVLDQDFIRTARSLGFSKKRILWHHALRNALSPLVQLLGLSLPTLLNGVLVIEVVFGWPGVGQVLFSACSARDYPLILATTAYGAILVIVGSLLSDLLQRFVDPRVRLEASP